MASAQSTVDYILDQLSDAGVVSAKKMFGEYGLYLDNKMVALVCDDQLFIKPTEAGKQYFLQGQHAIKEARPYSHAKPCFLIDAEQLEDSVWLSHLMQVTATVLPAPVKRQKKPKNT